MSINQFKDKIKGFIISQKIEILLSLIIIFVGLASFGLGRLSVSEAQNDSIKIEKTVLGASAALSSDNKVKPDSHIDTQTPQQASQTSAQVVASKSGTKYHFPWCSGAKRISEKNKIVFNSIEEARKAGYTPASNCKGLE